MHGFAGEKWGDEGLTASGVTLVAPRWSTSLRERAESEYIAGFGRHLREKYFGLSGLVWAGPQHPIVCFQLRYFSCRVLHNWATSRP